MPPKANKEGQVLTSKLKRRCPSWGRQGRESQEEEERVLLHLHLQGAQAGAPDTSPTSSTRSPTRQASSCATTRGKACRVRGPQGRHQVHLVLAARHQPDWKNPPSVRPRRPAPGNGRGFRELSLLLYLSLSAV